MSKTDSDQDKPCECSTIDYCQHCLKGMMNTKRAPSTDIEEVAFDATNRIKRMISETAPKDSVQLGEFILSVITEALVDTVTASCEQLAEENARMRAAIEQTICWQESVDASNTDSVRPLLELDTQATESARLAAAIKMLGDIYLERHKDGTVSRVLNQIRKACEGGL